MNYLVSITSQGQVSIPAQIRRELGLSTRKKVLVTTDGQRVLIEPIQDILALEGSLAHKAIKGKTIEEIIKLEEEAIGEAVVERYKRKIKGKTR